MADEKEALNPYGPTVEKFLSRTSFPTVPRISSTKSNIRKGVWFFFLIFGISMALYLSAGLIKGYREFATLTTISEKMNNTILLPAITFCPTLSIMWDTARREGHPIYNKLKDRLHVDRETWKNFNQSQRLTWRMTKTEELLAEIQKMTKIERDKILPKREQIIIVKALGSLNLEIENQIFVENNVPIYGRCFTFNPGLPGFKRIKTNLGEKFVFLILLNENEIPDHLALMRETVVSFHAPGTAPEMTTSKTLRLPIKTETTVSFKLREMNRLPEPYPSACIHDDDKKLRQLNPYYKPNKHYYYSKKACKEYAIREAVFDLKKCNLDTLPLISEQHKDICNDSVEIIIDEEVSNKASLLECPLTCHELQYDWSSVSQTLYLDRGVMKDIMFDDFQYLKLTRGNLFSPDFGFDTFKEGVCQIEITLETNTFDSYSEEPQYTLPDIIGTIGGNISLWIGISILSCVEVLELGWDIILKFFKLLFCKRKKKARNVEEDGSL